MNLVAEKSFDLAAVAREIEAKIEEKLALALADLARRWG